MEELANVEAQFDLCKVEDPTSRADQPRPRCSDFISGYAGYADVLEVPRILHEIVAIELVASLLNRNGVTIPWGATRLSFDLWILLLSGSGAGRSTTVGLLGPVLDAANLDGLESSVVWGSAASCYQHFAENPCGLLVWGEMSERLALLNQPNFATVKPWLTDRYDNFSVPSSVHYRKTGKSQDTPMIQFNEAPRLNILATSSEDWFFRNIAETDSAGGFLARWLFVRDRNNNRDVPIPKAPNNSLIPALAEALQEIADQRGEVDFSKVEGMYDRWYRDTKHRFKSQPNPELAIAYFNRHRGHILKLAAIFEASESRSLKVSPVAFKRAVAFARRVEEVIFDLLPTGMSATGYDLQRIENRILQAGANGLSRNNVTRSFQWMSVFQRDQAIHTLLESERIFADSITTKGRTRTVYVHERFHNRDNQPRMPIVREGVPEPTTGGSA